jgi:hypothetical protein
MLRGLLLAQLGIDTSCCLGGRSCGVPLGPRSLLHDRTATTCRARLAVAMRRRTRAAVEFAPSDGLFLVEARAFARFVAHVGWM